MIVTKFVISMGKSVEQEDGTWLKVNYEITAEGAYKNGKELNRAKDNMSKIMDGWLLDKTVKTPPSTQNKKVIQPGAAGLKSSTTGSKIKIWTNWDKKECEEGEAGWAFVNRIPTPIARHLTWQWTTIGYMQYRLGGTEGKLVNRRPITK